MAAQGAPNKAELDYFPKMVNFYDDDKIFDLLDEYGPLGVTIYDCILTIVYSNGYYANLSKDKLSRMVIRKIGNKWIKSQKVAVQVIDYCAELGLLCNDLMLRNIVTSVGIQKRYYKIAVKLMKRQLYSKEYWLLDENGEPLLNASKNQFSLEENQFNSEENNHNSENSPLKEKESKLNKTKENKKNSSELETSPRLDVVFQLILIDGTYHPVCQSDVEKYVSLYPAANVEQEFRNMIGWLDSHPKKRKTPQKIEEFITGWLCRVVQNLDRPDNSKPSVPNKFHNFEQREGVNYNDMVLEQVAAMCQEGMSKEESEGSVNG